MIIRSIGLRIGHSPNCWGAVGYKNEYETMKQLYVVLKEVLESQGIKVIDCNSNASSENGELSEGAEKGNNNSIDLFISLHMDCDNWDTANGVACWTYGEGARANGIGNKIQSELSSLGFRNRGLHFNSKLYEMQHITTPNIILELGFCDSKIDCNLIDSIGFKELSKAITRGITGNSEIKVNEIKENTIFSDGDINDTYKVIADGLNFRKERSTDSQIIDCIPYGTLLDCWYSLNGWVSTRYKDKIGFVYSKYLSK